MAGPVSIRHMYSMYAVSLPTSASICDGWLSAGCRDYHESHVDEAIAVNGRIAICSVTDAT
jgi:hypothetical protein